jgi:hypothetical protein
MPLSKELMGKLNNHLRTLLCYYNQVECMDDKSFTNTINKCSCTSCKLIKEALKIKDKEQFMFLKS